MRVCSFNDVNGMLTTVQEISNNYFVVEWFINSINK